MRKARRVKRVMAMRPLPVAQRMSIRFSVGWVVKCFHLVEFVMVNAMFGELCEYLLKNVLLDVVDVERVVLQMLRLSACALRIRVTRTRNFKNLFGNV